MKSLKTAVTLAVTWNLLKALEGAILMMEGGRVRAMAGGAKNRYFNRATDARRQFGSIWKLLVYEAALEQVDVGHRQSGQRISI